MGYERHHAIVVTASDHGRAVVARQHAAEIFGDNVVTGLVFSPTNAYVSFMVPPDGSKEGWTESDVGDRKREAFIGWLDDQRYVDGSSPYDWAEVQFGDDERVTVVTRHSDEPERRTALSHSREASKGGHEDE